MDNNQSVRNVPVASREKLWTERDVEQKLEALRQTVTYLLIYVEEQREQIMFLERHQHLPNGELCVTRDNRNLGASPGTGYHRNRVPMSLRDKE